jgi:hypothetical protein
MATEVLATRCCWALLGPLAFADLDALAAEARTARRRTVAAGREVAGPGPALRALAVDRRLAEAVSGALDLPLAPTYRAAYLTLGAGGHVLPRLDDEDAEVVVHAALAGAAPLVVFHPDAAPARVELGPGDALALRGPGSVHMRRALRGDERWESLAIGFARA